MKSDIQIEWVPAHCGIDGNEMADQLAKQGANDQWLRWKKRGITIFQLTANF